MTSEQFGPELERLDLAAAAIDPDGFAPKRPRGLSAEQIRRELRHQQVDRYQAMLDRLNTHLMKDEITDEVFRKFRNQLREVAQHELGPERATEVFDLERSSAEMLKRLVAKLEREHGLEIDRMAEWDQYVIRDGRISGRVQVGPINWLPVINNELLHHLRTQDEEDYYYLQTIDESFFVDGQLATTATFMEAEDGLVSTRPVWQGKIQEEIEGQTIHAAGVSSATEAGWCGWVQLDSDRDSPKFPVHNGKIRRGIHGAPIRSASSIHDHDGKMSGLVTVGDGHVTDSDYRVVIDNRLITSIGPYSSYEIGLPEWVTFQELAAREVWSGLIKVEVPNQPFSTNPRSVDRAVIAGQVCDELDGMKIDGVRGIVFDDEGVPNGIVSPAFSRRWLPLVDGKIQEEIDGEAIYDVDISRFHDGTWSGSARLIDHTGPSYPVWHGKLVRTWYGRPIEQIGHSFLFEIDGTVNGKVYVRKGEDLVEEKLVLASFPPELRGTSGAAR